MFGKPKEVKKDNWVRRQNSEDRTWFRVIKVRSGRVLTQMTVESGEVLEFDNADPCFYETHAGYARNGKGKE